MGRGAGLYSDGNIERLTINRLNPATPASRIFFRCVAVVSLVAISILNHYGHGLPLQILLDFLYLVPITSAAFISISEGLAVALVAGSLRVLTNPLMFSSIKGNDYVDFLVVTGFYLVDPVTIELMRRLAGQRQQLQRNLQLTTAALLEALQMRDQYTGWHSRQVAIYARRIASSMGLSPYHQECLYLAGLLHDIGKIGVDDACLNKPGRLTPEEWQNVRRHPGLGYKIIRKVTSREEVIARAVLYHHERYDGCGYPRGLKGTDIPLEARILSVADCFDAMTTDRVYRPALSPAAAVKELMRCAGSQFDPAIVEVFCRILAADGLIQNHEKG